MNAVTSCEHDLVAITAAGPEEATTPIRKIVVGFSVPCAVSLFHLPAQVRQIQR